MGNSPIDASPPSEKDGLSPNSHPDLGEIKNFPQFIEEYPLTYGQRALLFVQQLHPEDIAHNIVYAVNILAPFDLPAFKNAVGDIVLRHNALRTRFADLNGTPVQRVYPGSDHVSVIFVDAAGWDDKCVENLTEREVFTPFDLQTGPLFRITIIKRSAQKYTLVLALHHIITDLWSMAILASELLACYAARLRGETAELKPIKATISEVVEREAAVLAGPEGDNLLHYWKDRLSGDLQPLQFPTDRPYPARISGRASSRSIYLPAELVDAARNFLKHNDANLFTFFLTLFNVLLYRYTGQTDLLVGTPKAGRNFTNAKTFGYFINPIILRTRLNPEMPFIDLLARVHKETLVDFEHDTYPYALVVEHVQPERSLSADRLLQTFFSLQKTHHMADSHLITALAMNVPSEPLEISGISIQAEPIPARVTPTNLALLIGETDDAFSMTIEYSTDLFDGETIDRMLHHLRTLMESFLINEKQTIGEANMLTGEERQTILTDWSRAQVDTAEPGFVSIFSLITQRTNLTPHNTAIEVNGIRYNYAQLLQRANTLYAWLQQAGVGPGTVVSISLERSLDMVASILAVLQSGGAFLPLDPDYPRERLANMLDDSGSAALMTHTCLADRLPAIDIPCVYVDKIPDDYSKEAVTSTPEILPSDPAYMLYTSGSTGQPKGVVVSHQAISDHCRYMQRYYNMTSADRVLQFASLNFDASLEQIFTTLITGATLVLRENILWDPVEFSQKIYELRLSVVNVPPAYWNQWVEADARSRRATGSQLRLVIIGGDVMLPGTLKQWYTLPLRHVRLINAYGPTETTITALAYEVPAEPYDPGSRLPIGRPMANRSVYILDPNGQPVPAGVPGELHIGGNCLAIEYHNHPDLTREKFIPDPFSSLPGARLYRTGDLARFRRDGNIEFLGRNDRQIKILGIRIEPGEIEESIKRHPAVIDAVVIFSPTIRLSAGVVLRDEQFDLATLAKFLLHQLPQYMIPVNFIAVNTFPLTPSGKLDRNALAERIIEKSARVSGMVSTGFTAPRNDLEADLAEMWGELLHLERVGIHDNFFALGGHSLLATQIMSRVRQRYGVTIPLRNLFETPTVANLALAILESLLTQENNEDIDVLLGELEN